MGARNVTDKPIDWKKPIQARRSDGSTYPVRLIGYDDWRKGYVVATSGGSDRGYLFVCEDGSVSGSFTRIENIPPPPPKMVKRWANVYYRTEGHIGSSVSLGPLWLTKELAATGASSSFRSLQVEIEIPETYPEE